ncbi:diguanylate cyclase [Pectinatus frisingensis]|uniref:diguanylate cyclase n=1 Tax=Pectinatus frisingensis TaxID=865 RepID=UPI0018C754F0|nr:diguanylate cyclase [Pectinatus frisingensis]
MLLLHFEKDNLFAKKIAHIAGQQEFLYEQADCFEQVYKKISKRTFDLLVIDQNINRILNNHVLKELTSTGFVYPPIIVITSKDNLYIKKQCFNMGILAYFQKNAFDTARFTKYLQTIKNEHENIDLIKNFKIAVIDDDCFSLETIQTFFLTYGIKNVNYYQKPSEFLVHALEYNFFLIDLVMPECNGDDLIAYIRGKNENAIIILITAYNNDNIIPHCLSIGANDFILKPLDFKLFMIRIKSCINQYYLKKELIFKNEKFFNMATRDALTGLYNRIYFIETCKNKIEETRRTALPLSFLLLDIDHFKSINDEYGHLKGDYVLKTLAQIMIDTLRKSDIICRWGGEEFIILLINTDAKAAEKAAEKLRTAISFHHFEDINKITSSFGLTEYQKNDTDESIFKRLDNSLYLAKLTGRNKVISDEVLNIAYGKKPMAIEWGPFFKSGNSFIDKDHHLLISTSNEIIYSCFSTGRPKNFLNLFNLLSDELAEHFDREEKILKEFHYPLYTDHKNIHHDLLQKTITMVNNLNSQEISFIDAAKYLIQEVIVGHIIKSDFDFYYILNKNLTKK